MAKRKIKESDFDHVADYVYQTLEGRKGRRKTMDKQIKEIDRQVSMTPKRGHKLKDDGTVDPDKAWLPEIELPLQAEALEVLTADTRSFMFPDSGPWFSAHSELTDEYFERIEGGFTSIIAGDENDIPSMINQDNADKLAMGFLEHFHRQYDFRGNMDVINAESFSYSVGVGRVKKLRKTVFLPTARGIVKEDQEFPVLVPRSIKSTYLEDRAHILMHEGFMVGPLTIFEEYRNFDDIKKQAASGSNDPESETGGWRKVALNRIDPDKNGNIQLIEAEGDFVIPRKSTGSIFLPGTIVTIAVGSNSPKVVRLRFRSHPFDSVLEFHYHKESAETPYGSSPLIKGLPIQAAATEALMRVVESSALNARPPVGYDRSDQWFAQMGGPIIEPGRLWPTISDINVHEFGNPRDLMVIYDGFLQQYADVVGVNRARLGAQTVSHTTAFAKQAEIQRGQSRTVDYARSTLQGALTRFLDMEYKLARGFKGSKTFYIDSYRGYVEIENKHLPDNVLFEAHGAGEPREQELMRERRLNSLREAMQMDQIGVQIGESPKINLANAMEQVLKDGGWVDTDPLFNISEDNITGPADPFPDVGVLDQLEGQI